MDFRSFSCPISVPAVTIPWVNSLTDQQLLRDYSERRSEAAFTELVRRHVDLVHSAALRMVRDAHLAEDVTQGVFLALARNAAQLTSHPVLSGWLHRTAQNLAANTVRSDVRRRVREQEAAAMNESLALERDTVWEDIAPYLDAALGELSEPDRDALLLRYFERKSAREMAHTLGTSEDAAQKRVSRAVERLREFFAKHGVIVGASGLVVVISANAVQAAPAGLVATVSAAVLAATTVATTATATITKAIAMTALPKALIGAVVVASVTTILVMQHQSQVSLRDENESLRGQIAQLKADNTTLSNRIAEAKGARAPRLPAPSMPATNLPGALATEELQSTNRIGEFLHKRHELTKEQVESYLTANRRDAASLLAAYRDTRNPALLEEAMRNYPNDPLVDLEATYKSYGSPEERRQWLDTFKQSAPDNALAYYLSAYDYFKAGQTDQAVQDVIAADGKPQFQDYSLERIQDDEEPYLAAGYSVVEAKAMAGTELLLPYLDAVRAEVRDYLVPLANSYSQVGDMESAQAALQMGVNLGQRYENTSPGEFWINQVTGMSAERIALRAMDPNSLYGNNVQTVQDKIDQLSEQITAGNELCHQAGVLEQTMSDQDWISYTDRVRAFGERAAMRWLVDKYGQK